MSNHPFLVWVEVDDDHVATYDGKELSGKELAEHILAERLSFEEELPAFGNPEYAVWSVAYPIQPGDLVDRPAAPELDDREVVAVGRDWLTLDIMGKETKRLPKINYRTTVPAEGSL